MSTHQCGSCLTGMQREDKCPSGCARRQRGKAALVTIGSAGWMAWEEWATTESHTWQRNWTATNIEDAVAERSLFGRWEGAKILL